MGTDFKTGETFDGAMTAVRRMGLYIGDMVTFFIYTINLGIASEKYGFTKLRKF